MIPCLPMHENLIYRLIAAVYFNIVRFITLQASVMTERYQILSSLLEFDDRIASFHILKVKQSKVKLPCLAKCLSKESFLTFK